MAKYTVSFAVDTRIDGTVEAGSMEEAIRLVREGEYDLDYDTEEWVSSPNPVNIAGPNGEFEDF